MRKLFVGIGGPVTLLLAAVVFAGCGDAAADAPQMADLQIACANASQSGVDGQVVESISVKVTDPNRDLTGVEGTLNGIQITLTDDDADLRFSWSPPQGSDPMACQGDFVVSLEAVDQAGHTSSLYKVVEK